MSSSLWPCGLKPTRLLCPWDFPGKRVLEGRCYLPTNCGRGPQENHSPRSEAPTRSRERHLILQFDVGLWGRLSDCPAACVSRATRRIVEKRQAAHRKGADLSSLRAAIWHQEEVSFQRVKWKLQQIAGLELSFCYQKLWMAEWNPPHPRTLTRISGQTERTETRGMECQLVKVCPQQISHPGTVQWGVSLQDLTKISPLEAYQSTSVACHCYSRENFIKMVRDSCLFPFFF